jgi:high-affinity nickel-transport protein
MSTNLANGLQALSELAGVVFLLGVRHGFDADHLAAIDALARANSKRAPALARYAGALFALGHGAVVLTTAVLVATLAHSWQAPAWIRAVGVWSSASVLIILSLINLASLMRTPAGQAPHLHGWRSALFGRLLTARGPWMVAAVGSLFALSFDTLGVAALVGVSAIGVGGGAGAAMLAAVFIAGMLLIDGLNGFWVCRLIERADGASVRAARLLALTICAIGILTATFGIVAELMPAAGAALAARALWLSIGIGLLLAAGVGAGARFTRAAATSRHPSTTAESY